LQVLTYLLGPILALLPIAWRKSLPGGQVVNWRIATVLSGFAESAIALIALVYWYSYSVSHWAADAVDAAIRAGAQINPNAIGFAGLALCATHPLTWLIAYAGIEGMVRLVGTFTETYLGIFPLFVMHKIIRKVSGRSEPDSAKAAGYSQGHLSSYVGAIREKATLGKITEVPDELCFSGRPPDEFLEIRACRRKADWTPPRTVLYQGSFYRLEANSEGNAPRPFRYTLRKLSAGVMGRTVLVYSPEEAPVLTKS
jgi:hypothetical protein